MHLFSTGFEPADIAAVAIGGGGGCQECAGKKQTAACGYARRWLSWLDSKAYGNSQFRPGAEKPFIKSVDGSGNRISCNGQMKGVAGMTGGLVWRSGPAQVSDVAEANDLD
jgi:hypothetical protein